MIKGLRLWSIPLAAAVGLSCGVTVLLLTTFNYLVAPIGRELGLTSAEVSLGLSLHILGLIAALPFAGLLCDRFGARRVICVSALAFGLALFAVSRIGALRTELYATLVLAGIAGAGVAPVAYARSIVRRFDRHRGAALGLALAGVGVASIILPPVVLAALHAGGWRSALQALAVLATGAGLIGGAFADGNGAGQVEVTGEGAPLGQAVRRWRFWGIAFAFALVGVVLPGVMAHLSEIFSAAGWSRAGAPLLQAALGVATIAGRIGGGMLMDRIAANQVGAGAACCGALGLSVLAMSGGEPAALITAGLLLGLCLGAESDVASYLSSRYFGARHFSAIYALQTVAFMLGAALGPYAAALVAHGCGYATVFICGTAGLAVSAAVLAVLPSPRRA